MGHGHSCQTVRAQECLAAYSLDSLDLHCIALLLSRTMRVMYVITIFRLSHPSHRAWAKSIEINSRHGHPVPPLTADDHRANGAGAGAAETLGAPPAPSPSQPGAGGSKKAANVAYASSDKRAMERVKEIVNALPQGIAPKVMLDIGCADGSITGAIAQTLGIPPEDAHGVDIAGLGEK